MSGWFRLLVSVSVVLHFAGEARAETGFFNSAGVKICYAYEGRGEPVISLHGWLDNGQQTLELPAMLRLARNFRVIAPDLRGHGNSGKPLGEQNYGPEMVRDVVRLMDHLRIRRAHVIGHSMGGMIVAKLLVDHPQRAKSAVISGSGGIRKDYDDRFVNAFARSVAAGLPTGHAIISNWRLMSEAPLDPATRKFLLSLNRTNGMALASAAKSWKQLEVTDEELKKVAVPTLLLCGQRETPDSRRAISELAGLLPKSVLHEVAGGTHRTTPTLPEYARVVEQFLLSTSGGR